MKTTRQLITLFLAVLLAIGVFSIPTVAFAEEVLIDTTLNPAAVQINYVNERLEVTKIGTEKIYYTMKYSEKTHSKTEWERAYESSATQASIDFSNTSPKKDVIFYLTEDRNKRPIEITVKAQENALAVAFAGTAKTSIVSKIKYKEDWTSLNTITAGFQNGNITAADPWAYGYLCVTVGKVEVVEAMTADEAKKYLEFRKGTTGAWQSIENMDLRRYAAYGAQLYFRIKASNETTVLPGGAITKLGRASNEVKVTYARQQKAPKISINGTTKQIALYKTQEYRVFTTAADGTRTYGHWIPVKTMHMVGTKVETVYLKDLLLTSTIGDTWSYDESNSGQGIQLRVAASDKAIASKVATVELNQVAKPTVGTGAAIQFELIKSTTYDKGIKVINTAGPAVQVAVVNSDSFDINNKTLVKWTNVGAGKTTTLRGTVLAKGDRIIVRTMTVKDNTKTNANEFLVSSDYVTYMFKEELSILPQKFEVKDAVATASVAGVSPQASLTGSSPYVVTVTNTASPSAITVVLNVTTENIASGTPQIFCVTAADDSAKIISTNKVKLLTYGAFTDVEGKLKISIAQDATTETAIFRVTIDGKKTYITVNFKTN